MYKYIGLVLISCVITISTFALLPLVYATIVTFINVSYSLSAAIYYKIVDNEINYTM
jgi:hypothetical protein